jgi:hypothetical protein
MLGIFLSLTQPSWSICILTKNNLIINVMKKILFFASLFMILVSCSNQQNDPFELTNTTEIEGSWSLVSVSGGFAPTINLNPSWITYNFRQNLTVINNSPITTAQSLGLEMGSYTYLYNEISSVCSNNYRKLFISGESGEMCVKIEGNQMEIDQNVAADGQLFKFVRKECGTPEPCFTQSQSYVESAIIPESGTVNQPITIQIAFTIVNGCGNFGYLGETNSGSTKTLKVYAKYPCDSACTLALGTLYTNYTFTPTSTGNQIIKLEQPDGSFLTYTIQIQ